MFEDRSLKIDLVALALLALVAFLGVALWTYDATDPPSTIVWPPTNVVHNACGRAGALTSHYLFESVGVGAYYLAGSLVVLTFLLLRRREIDQPIIRALGWAISVAGLTTLAALLYPNWTPGPIVGAGGYIGAMGRSLLEIPFRDGRRLHFHNQRPARRPAALHRLLPLPRRRGYDVRHWPIAAARRPRRPQGVSRQNRS